MLAQDGTIIPVARLNFSPFKLRLSMIESSGSILTLIPNTSRAKHSKSNFVMTGEAI
jgi:hypothetical protein